ncbi:hypothetical protein [Corallococcus carmarthensis]|uniref:hypothetical protein n=1 Tax=Corallococcus carmarthensis TaxID=2316728 RepID=UPI001FCA0A98|nr:hypothetical protein [Corallococcus carmarthensis]
MAGPALSFVHGEHVGAPLQRGGDTRDAYRVAKLPARLRGFAQPDTSTQPEGYVEAGGYLVLEEKARHPTPDTDYVRLLVPQLRGLDTWVCTRWHTQRYATLVSQERSPAMARLLFDSEPLAVLEERLTTLLGAFLDYRYDGSRAYYPRALPGVRVPLAPPRLNNCCTFVEALLVKDFSEAHGAWDRVARADGHQRPSGGGGGARQPGGPIVALAAHASAVAAAAVSLGLDRPRGRRGESCLRSPRERAGMPCA